MDLWREEVFDTREEAKAAAKEELGDGKFSTGRMVQCAARQFYPDHVLLLEHMDMQAYDAAGEASEHWLDATDEAEKELTTKLHALLDDWLKKHGLEKLNFYRITDVKEHTS